MAAVSCDEMFYGRSASWSVGEGPRYVRRFRVVTNYSGDDGSVAINATGLRWGDKYVTINNQDPNAFVTEMSAEQEDDPLNWIVTIVYSWYSAKDVGGGPEQNPLLMPIDVVWGWRDYDRVLDRDIDGKQVTSSAGGAFNPPITIHDPMQTMTVTRNEAIYDSAFALQYKNSINDGSFAGQSAFFVHCVNITPKSVFHNNVGFYYQLTYEYEFMSPRSNAAPFGFRKYVIDQDLRQLGSDGKAAPILLKGVPTTVPLFLDGSGKLLAPNAAPFYLTFKAYPELDFDQFNFDAAAIDGTRSGFPPP